MHTRESEAEKYGQCYARETYHLQGARLQRVKQDVDLMESGKSYLDVGCGRGEMIQRAKGRGLSSFGLELVPELCDGAYILNGVVTDIPFDTGSFDYVSCYDMLEHLPESQVDKALDELFRVGAGGTLFLTTNEKQSRLPLPDGKFLELHLTRKPRAWWDQKMVFRTGPGCMIHRSEYGHDEWHWQIDLS